ncbi:MAG: phosphoenolpyruvate synthase, partial [Zetaproteobacteria bacterium]
TLARTAARAREIVYEAGLPEDVRAEILAAYAALSRSYGEEDLAVAVRSSATAEDLPEASFAGQQDSYLNVQGPTQLLETVLRCFTSLFTDRAIHYRIDHGFDHMKVAISVGVMKMVRSDLASSGVMFTLDTETGFRDVVMITSAYGLGENVVQGQVDPDEFFVHKPTFQAGHRAVLARKLGSKEIKMVCVSGRLRARTQNVPTSPEERNRFSLTDEEVLTLADYALKIEAHFSQAQGRPMPMDIEWAKDGLDGKLYIVQARPETVRARETGAVIERFRLLEKGEVLCEGRAVGTKIAQGKVRIVHHPDEMRAFQPGEVLVAEATAPDWEPVMKKAAAIVTNRGGRTCHAAIVARELGIPAVVGCGDATSKLADGLEVTVSCAEGETGRVYRGRLRFAREEVDVARIAMPKTRIMMNIGHPERAFALQALPNAGVGLARIEFIIAERIRAHPLALLHPEELSEEERAAIERLAANDPDPAAFFVRVLSEGIGQIAAAFWPKPVIVRTSDFKSNEYANLIGGRRFEPEEENPMLGLRGAARYLHPRFQEAFRLECMALKRVRETMGLVNVRVMIPFCRTLDEAEAIV